MSTYYTLTFSENSKGWPSFYSFKPEMMVGMNNSEMREMGGKELLRREGRAWGLNAWFQQTQRDMEKLVELYKKTQS